MFKSIQLTCFRKHQSLSVNFTEGLNAIRAANEAGKSTLLQAMAYALFGARALNEPLSDVVTYDHKESELKVKLVFQLVGVEYTVTRGKSGAELTFGQERVTGQTEVTRFVESLLGASADTTSKLMLAKQSSVAGALAEGPGGAIKLIEILANFELINELVELVQAKLPTGNTAAIESQITTLEEVTNAVVENDLPAKREAVLETEQDLKLAKESYATFHITDLSVLKLAYQQAANKRAAKLATEVELQRVADKLSLPLPTQHDEKIIAECTEAIAQQRHISRIRNLRNALQNEEEKAAKVRLQKPLKQVSVELAQNLSEKAEATRLILEASKQEARLEAHIIKETNCAFCGKDLKDVPEVSKINSEIAVSLAGLKDSLNELRTLEASLEQAAKPLRAALAMANDMAPLFSATEQYIALDTSTTPATYTWSGPDTETVALVSFDVVLARQNELKKAYLQAVGGRAELQKAHDRLKAELATMIVATDEELAAMLREQHEAEAENEAAKQAALYVENCVTKFERAKAELRQEQAIFDERCAQVDRAKVQLENLKGVLAEQIFNNNLIKKMRLARPQVADKLWSIVLASVSTYFSAIRGELSVVSRSDNTFQVNGRPITGLSGSTLDALGLAIRIALAKTFLPRARFLLLDEVAAGMDDERETALLGLIAACDMDQVILITHSPLADSFANNVINF